MNNIKNNFSSWYNFKVNKDKRGSLISIEENSEIPIPIKRIFYMTNISEDRGGHAHIDTDQVIIAISGSFKVTLFDGKNEQTFLLDNPENGIYVPRLTFTDLYNFSQNAICLVLANTKYDFNKSIRTLNEFKDYINNINKL